MRTPLLAALIVGGIIALALLVDPDLTGFVVGEDGVEPLVIEVGERVSVRDPVRVDLPSLGRVSSVRVYGTGILTGDDLVVFIGGESYRVVSVSSDRLTGMVAGAATPSEGSPLDPNRLDLDRVVGSAGGGGVNESISDLDGDNSVFDAPSEDSEGGIDVPDSDGNDSLADAPGGLVGDDPVVDVPIGGTLDENGSQEVVMDEEGLVDTGSLIDVPEGVSGDDSADDPGDGSVDDVSDGVDGLLDFDDASDGGVRTVLRYGDGPYDVDNDGRVGPQDAVDFVVDTDASCVIWSVVSESASLFCRGESGCCREFGFVESRGEPANELVLTRELADGVAGSVLARAGDLRFSDPLTFSFAGSAERFVEVSGECGSACSLDTITSELVFSLGSGRFTIDRVEVEYDSFGRDPSVGLIVESGLRERLSERLPARASGRAFGALGRVEARLLIRSGDGYGSRTVSSVAEFDDVLADESVVEVFEDRPVSFFSLGEYESFHSFPDVVGRGSGVRVCVVDSGVDISRLDSGLSFVTVSVDNGSFEDTLGHGTRVARLVTGLASGAEFVFVKVDRDGFAYESDYIAALELCGEYDADVVSLSLGSGSYAGFCSDHPVSDVISGLSDVGVLVVAAAGNDGLGTVRMPACSPDVLSVVRVLDDGSLSSSSSFVEGLSVFGALGEFSGSLGTSLSAPAVSAAGAVLLEGDVSSDVVFETLVHSGDYLESASYSVLNVSRALEGETTNDLWSERDAVFSDGEDGELEFLSTGISSCQTISSSGAYHLTQDISAAGTCFTINVSNVSLYCQGHTINYSTADEGYGILIWSESANVQNVNISNCNIVKDSSGGSSSSRRPAILGYGRSVTPSGSIPTSGGTQWFVDNVSLENLTIETTGEFSFGVYGVSSRDWIVKNVSVSTSGSYAYGVFGSSSSSWVLSDFSVSTSGSSARGVFGSSSSSWVLSDFSVSTSGSSAYGVYGSSSSSWVLSRVNVSTSNTNAQGLYVHYSDDWFVEDSHINSASSFDVEMRLGNADRRLRLVNTSFDPSSVTYPLATSGWIDRGWWVDAYVNDTLSDPLDGANVSWVDSGSLASNPSASGVSSTNASGLTPRFAIYEYSEDIFGRTYHSNYTFNATPSGPIDSAFVNITDNTRLYFTVVLDTCTPPGSGDWIVEISDNCVVSTTVDIHPNALRLTGSGGTFTITSSGELIISDLHYEPSVLDGTSTFIVETGGNLNVRP